MKRTQSFTFAMILMMTSTFAHAQQIDTERTLGATAIASSSLSALGALGAKIENDSIKSILGQATLRIDPATAERNLFELTKSKLLYGPTRELYNSFADDAGKIYYFDRNGKMTRIIDGRIVPATQAEINRYASIGKAFAEQKTAELVPYRKVVRASNKVALVAGVVAAGSTVAYALTRNTNPEVKTKIKYQASLQKQGNK